MIGLVTARRAASLDPDLGPLEAAMQRRLGPAAVAIVAWDDDSVDWHTFDAVVLRSTWDYAERHCEFLRWIERVDRQTVLVNPADVVRWSADKRYLAALASEGIPITPTEFVKPGQPAPSVEGVHVVKPAVGAGSGGARRCEPDDVAAHVASLHANGSTAMVQPYLDLLDSCGETALCFVVDGTGDELVFSHAFGKGAILTGTDVEREGGLFAKEEISSRVPTEAELALAWKTLASDSVARLGEIVFARVDVAPFRTSGGHEPDVHVLMELELVEPSFYFETSASAADAFARGLIARLAGRGVLDLPHEVG